MFLRALSSLPRNLPALTLQGQCYSSRTARADIIVSKDSPVSVTAGRELLLIILADNHPPVQLLRADAFFIGGSPTGPSSEPTLTHLKHAGPSALMACSVNANLYTKYDAYFFDALCGIVNKADSVSGMQVRQR